MALEPLLVFGAGRSAILPASISGIGVRRCDGRVRAGAGTPVHPRAGSGGWRSWTILKLKAEARNAGRLDPRPNPSSHPLCRGSRDCLRASQPTGRGEAPSWAGPQRTTQTAARPAGVGASDRVTPSSFTAGAVQAVPGIFLLWRTLTLRLVGTTDSAPPRGRLLKVTPPRASVESLVTIGPPGVATPGAARRWDRPTTPAWREGTLLAPRPSTGPWPPERGAADCSRRIRADRSAVCRPTG